MCHNCGVSTTFYNFLKHVDPELIKEYQLERYKNGETGNNNYPKPSFDEYKTEKPVFKEKLKLETIASLPNEHFAKVYVEKRKIPEKHYSNLYFAADFKKFIEELGIEKDGFITVKMHDDNKKVFGLDRIDEEKPVYVVEGPIDSLFIDNAVATADSNLQSITEVLDKSKVVLIFDNEPRNKEIVKQIEKAIDEHYNVVIWPEFVDDKDINDMILSDFSLDEIEDIISKNTFVNLRAKMEFVNWKKV